MEERENTKRKEIKKERDEKPSNYALQSKLNTERVVEKNIVTENK
jgi:hypothetical protein